MIKTTKFNDPTNGIEEEVWVCSECGEFGFVYTDPIAHACKQNLDVLLEKLLIQNPKCPVNSGRVERAQKKKKRKQQFREWRKNSK